MSSGRPATRAQSGIDRLALFLLGLFLVLLVTPTVLGFAGVDVRESAEADDEAPTLTFVTGDGASVRLVLSPPESLPGTGSVPL